MKLHGRPVRMAFTAGAMQDVAQLCPGKDIRRMDELFDFDDKPIGFDVIVKFVSILSYWGEQKHKWENPGYDPAPFSVDELYACNMEDVKDAMTEGIAVIRKDNARSVETEPDKPEKN